MPIYGKYDFHAVFEEPAILPPFKGSTYRGVFGIALKKVVCALQHEECATCILNEKCIYFRIFEPPSAAPGKPAPPHPFVIEAPATQRTQFYKGDPFTLSLLLFGWANEYLAHLVYACRQMGTIGVGRRINGARGKFTLESVTSAGARVYSADDGRVIKPELSRLQLETPVQDDSVFSLRITLETPLRLKFQNTIQADLPFHVFTRALLRRISGLCEAFGEGEPALDYRGLVARAQDVRTVHSTLEWLDRRRYSNRQERDMLMGGITGSVTYSGKLQEFLPLVQFCEEVHVGKATSFGLGKIHGQREE